MRNVGSLHLWQSADGPHTVVVLSDVRVAADGSKGKLVNAEWHGGRVAELTAVWGGATAGEQEASKGLAMVARLAAAKPKPRQDHGILCMHVYNRLGLVGWIFVGGTTVR